MTNKTALKRNMQDQHKRCYSKYNDCSSFSQLLKKVMTANSAVVGFQGQNEMSQEYSQANTNPDAVKVQLDHQAECPNPSAEVLPCTPASISVPNSAFVTPRSLSKLHKDAPGLVLNQQNSHHNTSLPRIVMEAPAADGYSWRKYGQKQVTGSKNFRSYYRCVHSTCQAKKKVQHCDQSGRVLDTVYISDHNHDPPQKKCIKFVSSVKPAAGSQTIDPSVQNSAGSDTSVISADGRYSSLQMPESEQQSSSSSNGNAGVRVEESKQCLGSSVVGPHQIVSYGIAGTKVQEKHGAERRIKIRMKERGVAYSVPVSETTKEPEIAVRTVSDEGSLSDGYQWRKYGQKKVKGNSFLRSYYRCKSTTCPARKLVERAMDDATSTTITYEGKHDHDEMVPKKRHVSESPRISPAATMDNAPFKKSRSSCSQGFSMNLSGHSEVDLMGEKILELGGEQALESAQTLLSIGLNS